MRIVTVFLAVVTAIVGDDHTVPCLSAGEPLKMDTTTSDLKGVSYLGCRVWAYVFETPSAIGVTRKSDLYFEPLYLRNVLDFIKPVKEKIPSELTLDTTGLAPGDHRVNVVINQRLNSFAFRIRLPEPSAAEENAVICLMPGRNLVEKRTNEILAKVCGLAARGVQFRSGEISWASSVICWCTGCCCIGCTGNGGSLKSERC